MTLRALCAVSALACAAAGHCLVPPRLADAREVGSWLARPLVLPLAWSAMDEASASGDATETFARGQQILHLLPSWTDGHAVFAYRYALDDSDRAGKDDDRAARALRRLQTALAWLEDARTRAGRNEFDLLLSMAFLPEVAAMQEPGIEVLWRDRGGSLVIADGYLAAAERLRPTAAIREQRTFLSPRLAAGLLQGGHHAQALAVLDAAVARSTEVRDQELAAEWRARVDEVRRHLRGEPGVDLSAVRNDVRFQPLLPHLR